MLTAMQNAGGVGIERVSREAVRDHGEGSRRRHRALRRRTSPTAEQLLKEATAIEATLDAPSGPPEPIKPSFELYGQFLLAQGRAKDAAAQFEQSLLRMPNRRLSVQGLERETTTRRSTSGRTGAE